MATIPQKLHRRPSEDELRKQEAAARSAAWAASPEGQSWNRVVASLATIRAPKQQPQPAKQKKSGRVEILAWQVRQRKRQSWAPAGSPAVEAKRSKAAAPSSSGEVWVPIEVTARDQHGRISKIRKGNFLVTVERDADGRIKRLV